MNVRVCCLWLWVKDMKDESMKIGVGGIFDENSGECAVLVSL